MKRTTALQDRYQTLQWVQAEARKLVGRVTPELVEILDATIAEAETMQVHTLTQLLQLLKERQ